MAGLIKVEFNSSKTIVVPAGVTAMKFECWGGGGSGEGALITGGGGGGGGAYARVNAITVTPGGTITITIGSTGADTWVSTTGVAPTGVTQGALAKAGQPGSVGSGTGQGAGGPGGTTAASIGDNKFAGGAGGGGGGILANGGGGGGAAGDANAGSPGNSGGPPGAGGSVGGGGGGTGGALLDPATLGAIPGGGGGGASTLAAQSVGRRGRAAITWSDPNVNPIGKGTVAQGALQIQMTDALVGKGTATGAKAVVASKSFSLEGKGTVAHTKNVELPRSVVGKGFVTGKIEIPIDEVPEGGGGGETSHPFVA